MKTEHIRDADDVELAMALSGGTKSGYRANLICRGMTYVTASHLKPQTLAQVVLIRHKNQLTVQQPCLRHSDIRSRHHINHQELQRLPK
jgi:hypothetical protein